MFDLTPTEKRAVLTLVLVICGAGIIQLFKPMLIRSRYYDYTAADSIFARTSRNFIDMENDSSLSNSEQKDKSIGIVASLSLNPGKKNKQLPALGTVDLNQASTSELELLPQIGPAMAKRIVAFRNSQGRFKSLQDLRKIKGIGAKTFKTISPYLKDIK